MKEDFLHYLWRYKRVPFHQLRTTDGKAVEIIHYGDYLQTEGPDFFNARIRIDGQLWAGNVEMHTKSSDWYAHRHEQDHKYTNVILHVVWEDDIPVFVNDNQLLPTLVLKDLITPELLHFYGKLIKNPSFLLCEAHISRVHDMEWEFWKEKLMLERLEEKTRWIHHLLEQSGNDWEEVMYQLLFRNFGLNTNGAYFEKVALHIPYKIIRKERLKSKNLEALFFGTAHLLDEPESHYAMDLLLRYDFLSSKYQLIKLSEKPQFFKLRPDNFPTIRIAQFVALLRRHDNLFELLIAEASHYSDLSEIFKVEAAPFWDTHYVFSKESPKKLKKISPSFIDLLLINTILPFRYVYQKYKGKDTFDEVASLYREIAPEKNSVTGLFQKYRVRCTSAFDSQALLHLKKHYCEDKKCLHCAVGHYLLSRV